MKGLKIMQISKVNMLNTKSNTIQNNNVNTQPFYRNKNNSDSVSFGARDLIARKVADKVFLFQPGTREAMAKLEALPLDAISDISERIRFSSELPRTACGIHYDVNSPQTIVNRGEIRDMAIEAVSYIEKKVKAIGEILQRTRKSDLPISEIADHQAPGISFQIFPNGNNSFVYVHNDPNGKPIENFRVIDGQLEFFRRMLPDRTGTGEHSLSFNFVQDGMYQSRLYRISRFDYDDHLGGNMCLDSLHRTNKLFDGEAPVVITPALEIKE